MMDLEVLNDDVRQMILDCAEEERPSEMCGVVVFNYDGFEFLHLKNVADSPSETFEISADAWLAAERAGEVAAVVHSHPAGEPFLSVRTGRCRFIPACRGYWLRQAV